jgi:rhodanese-related sulfurtransferase
MLSHLDRHGIEDIESHLRALLAKRGAFPFLFELYEYMGLLRCTEFAPLHLGHDQAFGVLGVFCDEVEFDVFFPVASGAREAGAAGVLKDAGGVVVDEFRNSSPQTLCSPNIMFEVHHHSPCNANQALIW